MLTNHAAPGVQYSNLYGLTVFDCVPLRATLQPSACASNWKKNLEGSVCRSCSLGAIHSGESPGELLDTSRKRTCIRCQRGAGRLLAGCLCLSCFNRAREVLTGRNAKGTAPRAWASRLHVASAIIQTQDAEQFAKVAASKRPRCTLGATALPQWSYFGNSHLWLEFVCSGPEELDAMLVRILPGATIEASDFRPVSSD
jgi:hypothetical protein